ncbi:hypothetical protein CMI47_10925 [Candidatus Pacearchaeota archaeon]|jgi:hypothetical protein|nr:hypothetical protein [Candidatus Pacearchaeota archaeon]|tara:strand:- start:13865 stop:14098 length:234 start_codon:yes stop_codon:yes gene_type:complete
MSIKTKFSVKRFGEVFNYINENIDNIKDLKHLIIIKVDISDNKYIKRIIELKHFPNIKFKHEFDGVWQLSKLTNKGV